MGRLSRLTIGPTLERISDAELAHCNCGVNSLVAAANWR
jgi:hypothetical protein